MSPNVKTNSVQRIISLKVICNGEKILIVEDDSRLAESLAVSLNEAGYETWWAENSGQGISKALAERPDLIITDLYLPDINAVEAITMLKKIPFTSGIPIVVLTAETTRQLKTKALNAGATEYLLKPISPRDLLKVVRRFCRPAIIPL
jgi:DNA-binding response OmpR family regulator